MPLDQRTNDLSRRRLMGEPAGRCSASAGTDRGSTTTFDSLVWDNPIRITDFNNGLAPPNGPYDPSGYSNGNGPAQGRNGDGAEQQMNVVSATGLYKLPRRTTLNGTLQFTSQTQDEALIPWTINSVINTPSVFAAFPHLAQLPRATARGRGEGRQHAVEPQLAAGTRRELHGAVSLQRA